MNWMRKDREEASNWARGTPSATSSVIGTASKSSRPESGMTCYTMLPSGQMCGASLSITTNVADLSGSCKERAATWLLRLVSHVSHSVLPEADSLIETGVTCGLIPFVSLEKSDPSGPYWKTYQTCFPALMGILDRYSKTWPRAGMMHAGTAYRLRPLVPITRETGSLLSRGMWPTPSARDWKGPPGRGTRKRGGRMASLSLAVNRWPTPTTKDNRYTSRASKEKYSAGPTLSEKVGGKLNPNWVEWLMGWPIGWTALEPLAMDRFRQWLKQFG
jgi:hypothetical protein